MTILYPLTGAKEEKPPNYKRSMEVYAMSDTQVQDYRESDRDSDKGHEDTRHHNFECQNPDPHLGCDPGIDVQG